MNKWTISQIEILTDYYTNRYAIPEALGDEYDILERSLCKIIGKFFENDQKKLIRNMNYKKSIFLFEDINKNLLKKVFFKKSKAALKSKYDDEIVIKSIVYK